MRQSTVTACGLACVVALSPLRAVGGAPRLLEAEPEARPESSQPHLGDVPFACPPWAGPDGHCPVALLPARSRLLSFSLERAQARWLVQLGGLELRDFVLQGPAAIASTARARTLVAPRLLEKSGATFDLDLLDGGPVQALGLDLGVFLDTSGERAHLIQVAAASFNGGDVAGMQWGAFDYIGGKFVGLQASAGANYAGESEVAQLAAGMNWTAGSLEGMQAAGGVNRAGGGSGVQVAGVANVARGEMRGLQLGGGLNLASILRGAQLALVNVAGEVGSQFGAINVATKANGLQVGLVNVAEESALPIGLVNIVGDGYLRLDAWGSDLAPANLGIKMGGRSTYSIIGTGVQLAPASSFRWSAILGLGAHAPLGPLFFVDTDLLGSSFQCGEITPCATAALATLRAVGGFQVLRHLALLAGPSLNLLTVWGGRELNLAPGPEVVVAKGETTFHLYPGFVLGVQI